VLFVMLAFDVTVVVEFEVELDMLGEVEVDVELLDVMVPPAA
jgi:hypothetical protein